MTIWKPLVCVCLKYVKEPTNKVDENAVDVVCTNSHCKEEVVCHMQQNISMIMSVFLFLPIVPWLNTSTMDVNTDWKFPACFHFYGPEKAIKLAQK